MQSQAKLKRHAHLVDHMADALGVDLEEKMMEGVLSPDELTDAVLRCTACTSPEECDTWLETRSGTAEDTPDYCRNAQLFHQLKGA